MFPEYIAHEGWGSGDELLAAHGANVFALSARKLLKRHALQRKFAGSPTEPCGHSYFGPLARIYEQNVMLIYILNYPVNTYKMVIGLY